MASAATVRDAATEHRHRGVLRVTAGVILVVLLPLFGLLIVKGPEDGKGDMNEGWWGAKTATVNWCEEDYLVTRYIAEFGNSLSSLCIVLIGIFGIVMHRGEVEGRFVAAFASFTVIGLGSCAFHSTLLRSMQLLDEVPMVWANSVFIYIVAFIEDEEGKNRFKEILALLAINLAMTIAIMVFDKENQDVFLLCYGSGVVYVFYKSFALNKKYNSKGAMVLVETSVVFYLGSFVFWLVDRLFCTSVRSLYLHAFWHVGAGVGTCLSVLGLLWIRYTVRRMKPIIHGNTVCTQWIEPLVKIV